MSFIHIGECIPEEKIGVLVAWNGGSCDMEWCYTITQGQNVVSSFSGKVKYFMDPLQIIKK